eukprot:TRINITY_DN9013_c0_g1_i1.p1 TRINITY_DN9013_c0_g1~~TRINITY_DN9013_c0_g1_i1.p1  ORF type:complete len:1203 (+),score=271.83 TRINITY_DN9013_c0_g1_i1:426-3611(+)
MNLKFPLAFPALDHLSDHHALRVSCASVSLGEDPVSVQVQGTVLKFKCFAALSGCQDISPEEARMHGIRYRDALIDVNSPPWHWSARWLWSATGGALSCDLGATGLWQYGAGKGFTAKIEAGGLFSLSFGTITRRVSCDGVRFVQVSCSEQYALALAQDGRVFHVETDLISSEPRALEIECLRHSGVAFLASGGHHSLILLGDGTLLSFGSNQYGQCGLFPGIRHLKSPMVIENLPPIASVAAGNLHSLAIDKSGRVWSWGGNSHGQCGNGSKDSQYLPSLMISRDQNIFAIGAAAGAAHSIILTDSGEIFGCGLGTQGQLGDRAYETHDCCVLVRLPLLSEQVLKSLGESTSPEQVISKVHVVCGAEATAVVVAGAVLVCGSNSRDQLGCSIAPAKVFEPLVLVNGAETVVFSESGVHVIIASWQAAILQLCVDGDTKGFLSLIESLDISSAQLSQLRSRDDLSLAHVAVMHDKPAIIQILSDRFVDLKFPAPVLQCGDEELREATAMHAAAFLGRTKVLRELLKNRMRAGIDQVDADGHTPLYHAVSQRQFAAVKMLVEAAADKSISSRVTGYSPLHVAVQLDDLALAKYLVVHAANLRQTDLKGKMPSEYTSFENAAQLKVAAAKRSIFVSYSHADVKFARQLKRSLDAHSLRSWIDDGLEVGSDWRGDIARALTNCDILLFLLSPRSVVSAYSVKEVCMAQRLGKVIVVVVVEEIDVLPPSLVAPLYRRRKFDFSHFASQLPEIGTESWQVATDNLCAKLQDIVRGVESSSSENLRESRRLHRNIPKSQQIDTRKPFVLIEHFNEGSMASVLQNAMESAGLVVTTQIYEKISHNSSHSFKGSGDDGDKPPNKRKITFAAALANQAEQERILEAALARRDALRERELALDEDSPAKNPKIEEGNGVGGGVGGEGEWLRASASAVVWLLRVPEKAAKAALEISEKGRESSALAGIYGISAEMMAQLQVFSENGQTVAIVLLSRLPLLPPIDSIPTFVLHTSVSEEKVIGTLVSFLQLSESATEIKIEHNATTKEISSLTYESERLEEQLRTLRHYFKQQ